VGRVGTFPGMEKKVSIDADIFMAVNNHIPYCVGKEVGKGVVFCLVVCFPYFGKAAVMRIGGGTGKKGKKKGCPQKKKNIYICRFHKKLLSKIKARPPIKGKEMKEIFQPVAGLVYYTGRAFDGTFRADRGIKKSSKRPVSRLR
jgi:hypothetical protein